MQRVFSHVKVINLSSRYEGWIYDVYSIIKEIDKGTLIKACPSLPWVELKYRLKELKYICLVGDLSRLGLSTQSKSKIEELENIISNIPQDKDSNKDSIEEKKRPPKEKGFIQEHLRVLHGREPEYDIDTLSVIDCYGIYVTSLKGWLEKNNYNEAITDLLEKLKHDTDKDGPAILLCPELIEEIYRLLVYDFPYNEELSLESNPSRLFLKLTLLHELGHHLFPVKLGNQFKFLWEAMANWFCYGCLNQTERYLLFLKTRHQAKPYQSYEGILLFQNAWNITHRTIKRHHNPILAEVMYDGERTVQFLEKTCFNKVEPIALINSFWCFDAIFDSLYDYDFLDPMQTNAVLLICELVGEEYYHKRFLSILKDDKLHLASIDQQIKKRRKLWAQGRILMETQLFVE